MGDKSQILRAFNNHFEEFVGDIRRAFPDDVDIETAEKALSRLRKANPKMLMNVFNTCVVKPYRNEINSGDIKFFINKDYSNDIGTEYSNMILTKIDMLREPVGRMESSEQAKVLKYIQNLMKLCDIYHS